MIARLLVCAILLSCGRYSTAVAQDDAFSGRIHIEVHSSEVAGAFVPRTIFGTFLEPIGNAIYNGLWAEILENPSFEANLWNAAQISKMVQDRPSLARASELGLPLPWEPLNERQGARYEPRWNDAANSYRSLFVAGLPEAETEPARKPSDGCLVFRVLLVRLLFMAHGIRRKTCWHRSLCTLT